MTWALRHSSPDELRFLVEQKWQQLGLTFSPEEFTGAEALAAITHMTGGNFRRLQHPAYPGAVPDVYWAASELVRATRVFDPLSWGSWAVMEDDGHLGRAGATRRP